jgi:hypothetical protein
VPAALLFNIVARNFIRDLTIRLKNGSRIKRPLLFQVEVKIRRKVNAPREA